MRTERLLRADGIIYGNVKGYYEDKHTYTFVINGKDIMFPKARYKLNKKDRYYDMDNRWNEDLLWRMEVEIMSKWKEIRCDFFDEEEEKYMVDAWKTDNDSEEGTVIAKLDLSDGTVEYINEDAKNDEYAQAVIKEMLENGYILTEWGS